jgi:O-antigen/teichoic acid export membrane protein
MDEFNLNIIKKKSVSSVMVLTFRTIILQVIAFIGYFFITVFLGREEFGLFILVSALVDVLGYFSDIGLAAALIQKKTKPNLKEIRSTFTIQQGLVLTAILLLVLLSPLIKRYYSLDKEGMILLYSFGIAFFFSSLKTIPTVLLERKLEFDKIVIPQVVETIIFNLVVVVLAWRGFGVTSYTAAVLLRAVSGTGLMYILAPWKIGFAFSKKDLKSLLKFGVPFQANSLLAVVKDKFMILFLGGVIGKSGIGLIGWAEKWANLPLRYFLDNTNKVAFPAFSRLQHDQRGLKRGVEAVLYFLGLLIFPALAGFCLIARPLTEIIPRYEKWQPALIPLYFYALAAFWGAISTLLTNALTAIGRIRVVFKLMVMWTVLTWLFTPFLAFKYGYVGVAVAASLVSFSSVVAIWQAKKYIVFNLLENVLPTLFSTFIMMLGVLGLQKVMTINLISLILQVLVGIIVYAVNLVLINRQKLFKEIKILLSYAKK